MNCFCLPLHKPSTHPYFKARPGITTGLVQKHASCLLQIVFWRSGAAVRYRVGRRHPWGHNSTGSRKTPVRFVSYREKYYKYVLGDYEISGFPREVLFFPCATNSSFLDHMINKDEMCYSWQCGFSLILRPVSQSIALMHCWFIHIVFFFLIGNSMYLNT